MFVCPTVFAQLPHARAEESPHRHWSQEGRHTHTHKIHEAKPHGMERVWPILFHYLPAYQTYIFSYRQHYYSQNGAGKASLLQASLLQASLLQASLSLFIAIHRYYIAIHHYSSLLQCTWFSSPHQTFTLVIKHKNKRAPDSFVYPTPACQSRRISASPRREQREILPENTGRVSNHWPSVHSTSTT